MADNIGVKLEADGAGEFKKSLKEINDTFKVLGSEMKLVASQFDKNDNSVAALSAKNEVLNKQIDEQKNKIGVLEAALKSSADQYGENDSRTQKWTVELNNAKAKLNDMEREVKQNEAAMKDAENATDNLGDETKKLGNDFDNAGKHALNFSDVLKANFISDAIVGGIRAIGAAIASAAQEFAQLATGAMDSADQLVALSAETGLTTEQLQVMQYVGDDLGVSLDTQTGALNKLVKNMSGAKDGTGTAAEAFKQLGISVTDANGNLRDSNEVYKEALDALGGVGNETERDAIAMAIFGKSARELNPLIEAGADGLAQLEQQAIDTGAVMSEETIAALDSLGDSIDHMKQSVQTAVGTFTAQFAPALSEVSEALTGLINGTVSTDKFIATVNELVLQVSTAITGALPTLIQLGGNILSSLLQGIIVALPDMVPAAVDILLQLSTTIIENLPLLVEASLQIIISLATGIADSLPELIPTIVDVVIQIVETLIENVDKLMDAAIEIQIALADGLIAALPRLLEKAPEIIINLVKAIIENVPKMLEAAVALIVQLTTGLASGFGEILGKVGGWIDESIIQPIKGTFKDFVNIGKEIVNGIWGGIKSGWDWLITSVQNLAKGLVDGVKNVLKIKSPSQIFRDEVGAMMADGIGVGFAEQMKTVNHQMQGSIQTSFPDVNPIDKAMDRMSSLISGAVNAMSGNGKQNIRVEIPISINGKEFYRASINDLWSVMSSNPRVVSDAI